MKRLLLVVILPLATLADWRDTIPPHIRRDTIRTLAWLHEPVAWETNALPPEVVCWPDDVWLLRSNYVARLEANGGHETNGWLTNHGRLKAKEATLRGQGNVSARLDLSADALEVLSFRLVLNAAGYDFSGVRCRTNPVPPRVTPTQYRWQALGLDRAPRNTDLERP